MNEHPESRNVELQALQPSPTNPRKRFDKVKLAELAENIKQHGVLQDLLVRPWWCVGWQGGEEPAEKTESPFEIVAGERRYRASLLALKTEAPCKVRVLTDSQALEIQLIENLQRDDLNPIEEAEGYRQALELRDAAGKPVFTVEQLEAKVGRKATHIYDRLKLLNLPKIAADALLAGEIPPKVAQVISRIPDVELREKAAAEIVECEAWIEGYKRTVPMTVAQAKEHVERHYMRTLQGATFDREDASLIPDAGPCSKCPHLAKNSTDPEIATRPRSGDMCLNPACFNLKADQAFENFRQEQAGAGRKVLTAAQNEKAIAGNNLRTWGTDLVPLDEKPSLGVVKNGVANDKKWRELVKDRGVEIVVARGENGKPIEAIDLGKAKAAAKLNGHDIFPAETKADRSSWEERQKREAAAKKRRLEITKRILPLVAARVESKPLPLLRSVLQALLRKASGTNSCGTIGEGVAQFTGRKLKNVFADAESASDATVCAVAAQALLVSSLGWTNEIGAAGKGLLKSLDIDPAKVGREIDAEKKKKEKKPAKPAPKKAAVVKMPKAAKPAATAKVSPAIAKVVKELLDSRVPTSKPNAHGVFVAATKIKLPVEKPVTIEIELAVNRDGKWAAGGNWNCPVAKSGANGGGAGAALDKKITDRSGAVVLQLRGIQAQLASAVGEKDCHTLKRTSAGIVLHELLNEIAKRAEVAETPPPKKSLPPAKPATLKDLVMAELDAAGPEGATVCELAKTLGVKPQNLQAWFSSVGKKQERIMKVGEARFATKPVDAGKAAA